MSFMTAQWIEASGMAVSCDNPNFLWIVNDSGAAPEIHLVQTDGESRGKLRILDAENRDWEDLNSFKLDGKSYLLVADVGDNAAKRETCTLYILQEPSLPAAGKLLDSTLRSSWQIQFRYEDGPRDCESVAVDVSDGKIILLSKRTLPPAVYELPLRKPKKDTILTAKKVGQTAVKAPAVRAIPFCNQPTSLDISSDSSFATVVTYYSVFLFSKSSKQSWAQAFAQNPIILQPHGLAQAESVAISEDGKTIYTISEGKNSPLKSYHRK